MKAVEFELCPVCNGCGEGRNEGSVCYRCDGTGEVTVESLNGGRENPDVDDDGDDFPDTGGKTV